MMDQPFFEAQQRRRSPYIQFHIGHIGITRAVWHHALGASSEDDRMADTDEREWPPHLDALVAAPASHRLLFEDDAVRVLEVTVQPGERENLHHHS